jgi:hypothetical protein
MWLQDAQVKSTANTPTFTKVYGDTLAKHGELDSKIVAITGAMPSGTGVDIFAKNFQHEHLMLELQNNMQLHLQQDLQQRDINLLQLFIQHFYKELMIK